tara:strand:+ start:95 stop:313 length:219 start_codon:yes stop_codon:yes gene_type:complete
MLPPCPTMRGKLVASLPKRVSRPALCAHFRKQYRVGRVCIPCHEQLGELVWTQHRLAWVFDGIEESELHDYD